jgi:hypothetical protein
MSSQPSVNQNITVEEIFDVRLPAKTPTLLTVADYANAKNLPEDYLRNAWRLSDSANGMVIPYRNSDGTLFREKVRLSLSHDFNPLMKWRGESRSDKKTCPYGLDQLPASTKEFWFVEGESDTQTAHYRGVLAVGASGSNGFQEEFAELSAFAEAKHIFIVKEPGEGGERFIAQAAKSSIREKFLIVTLPEGIKDISELHLKYPPISTHNKGMFDGVLVAAKNAAKPIPVPVEPTIEIVANPTKRDRYATKLDGYLREAYIKAERENYCGGYKWILSHCPFNREHVGTSAALFVGADGTLGFKCQHKSCADNRWPQFKDYLKAKLQKPITFEESKNESAEAVHPEIDKPTEAPQSEINEVKTEPEIIEEPLPEFPAITGSIAEFADALCPDIPREFKIMAAVTRVGLAISGKVQLDGELHLQPRFYTCFIAEAGRGKTAAIKETRIISFGYREVPSVDSAPALVDAFAESEDSPRCLLLSPDEAIDLFEKGKTSRDSRNSLFTELLKLYEDNVTGNRARRNESPIEIHDAHLAILCGATPSGYDGMWMGSRGASGGLQSRFVPVTTTASPMPAKQRPSDMQRVHAAVAHIRQQIDGCSPTLLTMTAEAEGAFKAWWESIPKDKPSTVRVEALVKRFLMVLAVTNDADVIGSGLMATGVAFGDYIIAVRDRFNPADASSWVHAFENKIVACHERVGVPITRNHCRRLLHPERHPGGFGDFIRAYSNVIQAGRLVPRGKTERDLKYGLDSRDGL